VFIVQINVDYSFSIIFALAMQFVWWWRIPLMNYGLLFTTSSDIKLNIHLLFISFLKFNHWTAFSFAKWKWIIVE
jgi:hypothetical protein